MFRGEYDINLVTREVLVKFPHIVEIPVDIVNNRHICQDCIDWVCEALELEMGNDDGYEFFFDNHITYAIFMFTEKEHAMAFKLSWA